MLLIKIFKEIRLMHRMKATAVSFVVFLFLATATATILYAGTTTDDFLTDDYINELLGSEVSGGELLNDDIQDGNVLSLTNASNGRIEVTNPIDAENGWTVGMWIKPNSSGITGSHTFWGYHDSSNSFEGALGIHGDGAIRYMSSYPSRYETNDDVIRFDQWNHIVLVANTATTPSLYINGVNQARNSVAWAGAPNSEPDLMLIGDYNSSLPADSFVGEIAQVFVYKSKLLTEEEIWKIYKNGVDSSDGDLTWYAPINDGSGTTITATVGSNGTAGAGTSWNTGSIYNQLSRTTSTDLLDGISASSVDNFKSTIGKKPGGSSARISFSEDGSTFTNAAGDTIVQGGYSFDGVNDYVSVADNSSLDFGSATDFTLSGWFKSGDLATYRVIVEKGDVTSSAFYQLRLTDTGAMQAYTSSASITTNGSYDDYKLHHVAFVSDRDTGAYIYIDGVLVKSGSSSTNDITNTKNLLIGARDSGGTPGLYFSGSISDVRIYSEALSAEEIWDLYANNINPDDTNLEGWWKLDGNTNDSAGSNNGTASGAVALTEWTSMQPVGQALGQRQVASFDGVDDYVDAGSNNSLELMTSDFTASGWVKFDSVPSGTGQYALGHLNISFRNGYYFGGNASGLLFATFLKGDGDYATAHSNMYGDGVVAGKWYHLTSVLDRDVGTKFYVNGHLADSVSTTKYDGVSIDSNVPLYIGGMRVGPTVNPNSPFNGQIANVAIYNDVRTPSEIATDYANGYIDTSDANLVSYWPLDGDYNDVISENHGSCSTNCPTDINSIIAPSSATSTPPAQESIDLTNLLNPSALYYRLLIDNLSPEATFALDDITLEYGGGDATALVVDTQGQQNATTTTTADIALGGAFTFVNASSTSVVESIKIDHTGTLNPDYIDDVALYYDTLSGTTTCPDTKPVGATQFGSSEDLVSGSTTFSGEITVESDIVCVYPEYTIDLGGDVDSFFEIGRSIDFTITSTSSISVAESGAVTLSDEPLDVWGSTILTTDGVQSLVLNMEDGTQTVFYVQDNVLYRQDNVTSTPGSGDDPVRLTSRDVEVLAARFTNLTPIDGRGQVQIELRIKYSGHNYIGTPVERYFKTTASLRR